VIFRRLATFASGSARGWTVFDAVLVGVLARSKWDDTHRLNMSTNMRAAYPTICVGRQMHLKDFVYAVSTGRPVPDGKMVVPRNQVVNDVRFANPMLADGTNYRAPDHAAALILRPPEALADLGCMPRGLSVYRERRTNRRFVRVCVRAGQRWALDELATAWRTQIRPELAALAELGYGDDAALEVELARQRELTDSLFKILEDNGVAIPEQTW
jgi:hypothetical protein